MSRSETIWKGLKSSTIPSDVTWTGLVGSCLSKRSQLTEEKKVYFLKSIPCHTIVFQTVTLYKWENLLPGLLHWKGGAHSCCHTTSMCFIEANNKCPLSGLSLLWEVVGKGQEFSLEVGLYEVRTFSTPTDWKSAASEAKQWLCRVSSVGALFFRRPSGTAKNKTSICCLFQCKTEAFWIHLCSIDTTRLLTKTVIWPWRIQKYLFGLHFKKWTQKKQYDTVCFCGACPQHCYLAAETVLPPVSTNCGPLTIKKNLTQPRFRPWK